MKGTYLQFSGKVMNGSPESLKIALEIMRFWNSQLLKFDSKIDDPKTVFDTIDGSIFT